MATTRNIEIFSAGCPVCRETVDLVTRLACPSCDITVLDIHDERVADRAKALGLRAVPAVAVDGRLAECCTSGPTEASLRGAGIGRPL